MAGSTADKLKGRLKEAAGAITGDEKLKKEGKLDQAAAVVKARTSFASSQWPTRSSSRARLKTKPLAPYRH